MGDTKGIDEYHEKQCIPSFWSKKHPNREEVINHFVKFSTEKTERTIKETATDLNISYGVSNCQKIDYFYCMESKEKSNNKPVFVYVHGGYWQEGDKDMYSFVTSVFTKHNFNCAVVGYDLAPLVSIQQIISQVTKAIEVVHYHFNQSQLIICGHSAGAFLAAAVALAKPSFIRDIVLISGVYDLTPLLHTSLNDALQLTIEKAEVLNSVLLEYEADYKIHIYVGEDESPWFVKQSELFHKKLLERHVTCTFKIVPNEDHFSIIENLVDEDSTVSREILQLAC